MSSIMDAVDAACGRQLLYEIPTIKPGFVRDNYSTRTRPIGILPWNLSVKMLGVPTYRSIMRTDLTVIFDAVLFDRSLYNPLFNFLSTLYLLLPLAKRRGKKLACYNVGVGPVETEAGRRMLKKVADLMDFITTRDRASYDILMDSGVTNPSVAVAADAALNAEACEGDRSVALLRKLDLRPDEEFLALNVNCYLGTWSGAENRNMGKAEFVDTYVNALNRVLEQIKVPVLVVATQHLDVPLSREVVSRLKSPERVRFISNVEHSHYEIKGVLSRASLLFAMRLHSMILASSGLTPVAGLAYQPKIHHYFEVLGMPEYSLDFSGFSVDGVADHVLRAWKNRRDLKRQLEERMPGLQATSAAAAGLVACMDRGGDVADAFAAEDLLTRPDVTRGS